MFTTVMIISVIALSITTIIVIALGFTAAGGCFCSVFQWGPVV